MLNPLDSIYKTSSQTISGVVLLHSDITVCDCSEDDRPPQKEGRTWHSEGHIKPRCYKKIEH